MVALITILGLAIIAIGLYWTGKYFSQSGAAEVAGVKANLPAGFFVVLVGILVVLFPQSSWYEGDDDPGPTTTTVVPPSSSTVPPTTLSSTTLPDTKIQFTSPKPNSANPPRVGPTVSVVGSGKIPENLHLWIFVYASDEKLYYTSGEATVLPDSWTFSRVILGGSAPGDIKALYTIYAVLADSNAHTTIETAFKENQGEVGTKQVPGGSGSEKVAYVTVRRVK